MSKQVLKLEKIRIDGGTQPRVKIDTEIVQEYSERKKAGDAFPAPEVFFDGSEYWLADGFHRYHSESANGSKTLECNVRTGTVRDAILFSCGANASHGLKRGTEDKQRAIETLLADKEWGAYSDRKIAEICCVDHKTVAAARERQVGKFPTSNQPSRCGNSAPAPAKRTGADGKSYPASQPKRDAPATPEKPADPPADDTPDPEEPAKVPKKFAAVFEDQAEFRSIVQQLGKTLSSIEELAAKPSGVFLNEAFERIKAEIGNAQREVKFAMPHQVCPYCKGAGCKPTGASKSPCRQTGWTVKGVKGPGE